MVVKCEYRTNDFMDAMVAGARSREYIGARAFIFRTVQCWFDHVFCSSMFKVSSIRVVIEKPIWRYHWSSFVLGVYFYFVDSQTEISISFDWGQWISWGSHGVPARSCGSPGTPWVAFSFLGPRAHGDMLHSWDLWRLGTVGLLGASLRT